MNPTHWTKNGCPKYDCRKDKCKCGLRYVSVPPALTSEMVPKRGLFCNAIVEYEETGAVYIYSTEGIPVLVKEGNGS